jgi:hypothetical protein
MAGDHHTFSRGGATMRVNAKILLLAAALLLAACASPVADGSRPIAQGSVTPAGPIKLSVGGYYGAAAGFTTR